MGRAKHRVSRRAMAAMALAVAMSAGCDGRPSTTPPAPAPAPAEVAAPTTEGPSPVPVEKALPQSTDLGADYAIVSDQNVEAAALGEPLTHDCPEGAALALRSAGRHRGAVSRLFDAPRGHFDALTVHRYDGDGAGLAMRDVRERLRRCAHVEVPLDDGTTGAAILDVIAAGGAGDDLLVARRRAVVGVQVTNTDFHLFLARGEFVVEGWFSDQRWTRDGLVAVAGRLDTRLCAALGRC